MLQFSLWMSHAEPTFEAMPLQLQRHPAAQGRAGSHTHSWWRAHPDLFPSCFAAWLMRPWGLQYFAIWCHMFQLSERRRWNMQKACSFNSPLTPHPPSIFFAWRIHTQRETDGEKSWWNSSYKLPWLVHSITARTATESFLCLHAVSSFYKNCATTLHEFFDWHNKISWSSCKDGCIIQQPSLQQRDTMSSMSWTPFRLYLYS